MAIQTSPTGPHARPLNELLDGLETRETGLTEAEAKDRLERFGPNRLPQTPPVPVWLIFLRQFHNPLIYILAVAAAVSMALGEWTDAVFIFAVLLINAVIGGVQEWKAEQSSRALQQLVRGRATVMRDGEAREIDTEAVVPGDVVWLESGNRVPADLRFLSVHGLEVDESLLTGESMAVSKDPAWSGEESAPLGDRLNMGYAGSVVARGRGKGVVAATGGGTEVGRLARDVTGTAAGPPPLIIRMERFTRMVGIAILAAVAVMAAVGIFAHGRGLKEMFFFSVALAVSAIPEGLPVAMTIALSVGVRRMARRGVIVRRLAAVEGLGSCTMIATDKTGTLTCNEMTVKRVVLADGGVFEVDGEGYVPEGEIRSHSGESVPSGHDGLDGLASAAVLCNEALLHSRDGEWTWRGDPTEVALLTFGHKRGITREKELDRFPQINEIPFESERKYSATFHRTPQGERVFVKGAPEQVLSMCDFTEEGEDAGRKRLETAEELAQSGYRVLALARGELEQPPDSSGTPSEPSGLTFLGFTGMIDPLRSGVREAVADCRKAGIAVTMVTGDHPVTALAIARDLGLADRPQEVVSGADLSGMSDEELASRIDSARVFARVAPDQKLRIVNAARKAGHFVTVTGDGVNDAPALRAANIGVSMGKGGTDVAREAAELVISDDNFATIVNGVEEGRVAYDNIRKVIYLLVSTGAAELVMILLCLAAGLPLPLLAVQLLWLNLVTNGIQHVGLAFEPKESDVLARPPRSPRERIFNHLMIERMVIAALVMGGIGYAAFDWMLKAGWEEAQARNAILMLMVLFENVHVGNCRSETISLLRLSPLRNRILVAGVAAAFLVHVGSLYFPPLQGVLQTAPIPLATFAALVGLSLVLAAVMEIHKWTWRLRHGSEKYTFREGE